jgi:small GTP-binding protein
MNQTLTPPLIDYNKVMLTLVSDLQQLQAFSQELALDDQQTTNVLQKIEKGSFSIAVVGEFNNGKSTFINALLGESILTANIVATTATLSRIAYGAKPKAELYFKDGREQGIALGQLEHYVTKLTSESEATATTLKEAVVYYPVPCCRNNVEIIDTPGLSDVADMTAVTLSVLDRCDLAIVVISALKPFSLSEGNFLTEQLLTSGVGRVLFVLNGIDNFNPEDAERITSLVETRIKDCIHQWAEQQPDPKECLKIGESKVFGVSALQALQAKQTKDLKLLAQSRFENFEHALEVTLNQERDLIRLQMINNQIFRAAIATLDRL